MNRIEFLANLDKYKGEDHSAFLQHYGILGQKWGQRRWQNADGTFNTEGKIRYFGSEGKDQEDKVGSSDKKIAKLTKKANNMLNTMYDNMDPETIKKQQDYMNNFSLNVNVNNSNQDQKVGATGLAEIGFAVASVIKAVHNYDDVQDLRSSYDKLMSASDKNYTPEERLSVMNNKKKIALMENALAIGDEKTYNRLLKKIKGNDKEAVEKFLKDLNEKNNAQKMPEDTQKKIEDSIEKMGSISKPKINKKYLNADGTLNDMGKRRTASNRKISDVASSVFLALRNFNLFELASLPIAGGILALSGFGVPAVLATALAGVITAPTVAIDNALYKKLEKRADAYYEMLK